jgi:signal transduction histidine kinase
VTWSSLRSASDLDELLAEACERFASASDRHSVGIESASGGAAWPSRLNVVGDQGKLLQVFSNLIDNAIKYSPEGGAVRVSYHVSGSAVSVSVRDEGVGIAASDQKKVFNRFEWIDRPELRRIRSTGLGLYIVREFMKRMGGDVRLTSALGEGSTFTVTLPLAEPGQAAA